MDQVLISLWDYLPVSIVLFDVFLLILLRRRMKDKFILRPIFLIPLILLAYPISGTLNLTMIQVLVGWYSGVNPISANRLVFGATAVFLILLLTFKSEGEGRKSVVRFKTSSLMTWIFWGTVIGAIANAVNFYIIGGVPIFWSNLTGSERFEVASRLPVAKFLAFSSAFLTLNIIFLAKGYKPRLLNIMCMIVNTIISVGIGSRQLVLLPLVTAGIYLMFIKRISNRVVLYSIVGLAVFSFFFQVIRGETTVVGSGDSSGTSSAISTVGFLYSLGGEYRDFVLLRDSYHYSNFLYGETILPIFTNIIPKQIFEVFGMDKAAYSVYSAYVAQNIWGAETGIRTGIWGEFYMNWGDVGLFVGFIIYGLLLTLLDRRILSNIDDEPKMLFYAFIFTLFLFGVIGAWATLGDTLEIWGVLYFVISKFVGRESYEVGTGEAHALPA